MKLDTCFVVHGVFDDTKQTLVSALTNDDGLTNQLVATKGSWRRHGSASIAVRSVQCRIQTAEIRTLRLRTATLCGHGDHIGAAHHKDTLVLNQLAVPYKKCAAMDVNDLALPAFATEFFHVVLMSNLGTVAVCRNSVLVAVRHL